tara:strand:- start:340 stop:456 length:117 start_codon:yes stop_codon:yes gene_type:complete
MELMVKMEFKVFRVLLVHRVQQDYKEFKVLQVHREYKV